MTSAKEMKIAVLETHGWGGICHYAFNLCAALKSIGKDVTLLTSEKNELQAIKSEFTMALIFNRSQSFFKQWACVGEGEVSGIQGAKKKGDERGELDVVREEIVDLAHHIDGRSACGHQCS